MGTELDYLAEGMERLSDAATMERRWQVAHELVGDLGCTAMNVVSLRSDLSDITYMRSSMSQEWLEEYAAESYISVDPFIEMIRPGVPRQRGGTLILTERAKDVWGKAEALHHNMARSGYRMSFGEQFDSDLPGERRLITLFSDQRDPRLWTPDMARRLQAASLLFNAFLYQRSGTAEEASPSPKLSGREQDVLLLLASGLKNDRIAERLGLAEITVRMHLTSARKRLGARTREQAVAIAVRDNLIRP